MTAKSEALDTLAEAQKLLRAPVPWTGLHLSQAQATLEYAMTCVERIAELKRARRKETRV